MVYIIDQLVVSTWQVYIDGSCVYGTLRRSKDTFLEDIFAVWLKPRAKCKVERININQSILYMKSPIAQKVC